jgi:putative FmdB family regulatory protein
MFEIIHDEVREKSSPTGSNEMGGVLTPQEIFFQRSQWRQRMAVDKVRPRSSKMRGSLRMPFYEYELCEGDCTVCGGKFTLRRPLSAPELTKCPACKKPVRKIISGFNSPKAVSISDAKKAGFTVLKRVGKGEYERQ